MGDIQRMDAEVHRPATRIDDREDRGRVKTAVACSGASGLLIGAVLTMMSDLPSDERAIWVGSLIALALALVAYSTISTRDAVGVIVKQDRVAIKELVVEPLQHHHDQVNLCADRIVATTEALAESIRTEIRAKQEALEDRLTGAITEAYEQGGVDMLVKRTRNGHLKPVR
jgi:hypothetical protein